MKTWYGGYGALRYVPEHLQEWCNTELAPKIEQCLIEGANPAELMQVIIDQINMTATFTLAKMAVEAKTASKEPESLYRMGQRLRHVKSGDDYVIREVPDHRKLEECNESFYEYEKISTGEVWQRAKSKMEDGRFVLI